jgi:hypothetical protein
MTSGGVPKGGHCAKSGSALTICMRRIQQAAGGGDECVACCEAMSSRLGQREGAGSNDWIAGNAHGIVILYVWRGRCKVGSVVGSALQCRMVGLAAVRSA